MIIINSPQNPTGSVSSESSLREVFDLAQKYNLWIYSDEIYARMNYGETKHFSLSSIDKCNERVILANGFSKAFAMTGWRLGTVVAPESIAERMMLLLQTTASCVQPFVQRAGLAALMGPQEPINDMMRSYKERRDFVFNRLSIIPGIDCHLPGGAFYVFPDISKFSITSEEFADRLLDQALVAGVPGSHFGKSGEGFIRFAYATSLQRLELAMDRLEKFCRSLLAKE
jgi:aminotransferase